MCSAKCVEFKPGATSSGRARPIQAECAQFRPSPSSSGRVRALMRAFLQPRLAASIFFQVWVLHILGLRVAPMCVLTQTLQY